MNKSDKDLNESDVVERINRLFSPMNPMTGRGKLGNYGYWRDFDLSETVSDEEHANSQKNLYRLALNGLHIGPRDNLLEIGCGNGYGTSLALEEYGPSEAHGIDLLPIQVARSRAYNLDVMRAYRGRLIYRPGSATQIPYEENKFDKFISIEVIPHFPSLELFVEEVKRVARRPARLAVACFFGPNADFNVEEWDDILPWPKGIHYGYSLPAFEKVLSEENLTNIENLSIGKDVFPGMHKWICQNGGKDTAFENSLIAYESGLMDYYLVTADLRL